MKATETAQFCAYLEQMENYTAEAVNAAKSALIVPGIEQEHRDTVARMAQHLITARIAALDTAEALLTEPAEPLTAQELEKIREKLARLTDENNHSAAATLCADVAKRATRGTMHARHGAQLHAWAQWVEGEHMATGELPRALRAFRSEIIREALEEIAAQLGEDAAEALRRAM